MRPFPYQDGSEHRRSRNSRSVLLVNSEYPPRNSGGTPRVIALVKHLPEYGWDAVVLTGPGDDGAPVPPGLVGTTVLRAPLSVGPARAGASLAAGHRSPNGSLAHISLAVSRVARRLSFPDHYAGWVRRAVALGTEAARDNGLVAIWSSGPRWSCHSVGYALAQRTGLPWVVEFRDPFAGLPPKACGHGRVWCARAASVETAWLARAQAVVVTSQTMREDLLRRLPSVSEQALHVITNGFDPAWFSGASQCRARQGPRTLTYLGSFYGTRSLRPLAEGARIALAAEPGIGSRIKVRIVGPNAAHLKREYAGHPSLQLMDICGQVSFAESAAIMEASDFLLLIKETDPAMDYAIPTKLFQYLGARRPVLALSSDCEATRLLEAAGVAMRVQPDNPEAIANAILHLGETDGAPEWYSPRDDATTRYAWPYLAHQCAALLSSVSQPGRRFTMKG